MTGLRYPVVRRPPHDPLAIVMDGRTGWRTRPSIANPVETHPVSGALVLPRSAASVPPLDDAATGLAGLVPPDRLAFDERWGLYLWDARGRRFLRFDPCTCAFEVVPCATASERTRSIVVSCDALYAIEDDRIVVRRLPDLVRSTAFALPSGRAWSPRQLAVGPEGLYVADPLGGAVHVFDRRGRLLRSITGLGGVTGVALDEVCRIYVVAPGAGAVEVLSFSGQRLERVTRRDRIAHRFRALPFEVRGASIVIPCDDGEVAFDDQGVRLPEVPQGTGARYESLGSWVTEPLDSRIERCVWDRVELRLRLPERTRIRAWTLTESHARVDALPPVGAPPWVSGPVFEGPLEDDAARVDFAIRSSRARYLSLALQLEGGGAETPTIEAVRVEMPRISLSRFLPAAYRGEESSADFLDRFLGIFDRGFREIEEVLDDQSSYFDARSAPAGAPDFLSWLASWVGITFDRTWSVERRRRYLREAGRLFAQRGTRDGLRRAVLVYLGIQDHDCPRCPPCGRCDAPAVDRWCPPPLVLEHFQLRRWLFVDGGRLGDQSRLWGEKIVGRSQLGETASLGRTKLATERDPKRDPFHHFAHRATVFLPAAMARTDADRRAVRRLVDLESPGHVKVDVRWVEPRYRIGVQSMIGYDGAIAAAPAPTAIASFNTGGTNIVGSNRPQDTDRAAAGRARVGLTSIIE